MGRHEQRDPWRDEWVRMMRQAWLPVLHVCGGLLIHAGTVWLYYAVTH